MTGGHRVTGQGRNIAIVNADSDGVANANLICSAPQMYSAIVMNCFYCDEKRCEDCAFGTVRKRVEEKI